MIELKHSNYKNYLPIKIIAFSYAYSGAQGEPGGVKIIDNNGKIFHFNYFIKKDLKENEIYEICPIIKDIDLNIIPKEWCEMNMGAGNKLYVNKSISEEVKEKTKDLKGPGMLYQKWSKIILDIIKK